MQIAEAVRTARDVGTLVRQARLAADLRQRDAADLCGVSERFLIELEGGKPGARLELVLKVCHGLGVTLEGRVTIDEASASTAKAKKKTRSRSRIVP